VRLLFVADTAPRPLRRLVEFLNAKMQDVEVAIVEVRQFLSDGSSVIVPRVIGVTEQSRAVKGRKPKTDRATMLGMCEPPAARFFAEVLDRCAALGLENNWGVSGFSVRVPYGPAKAMTSIMFCYPPNLWQVYLEYVQLPPDAEQALRQELAHYGLETRGKYTMAKNIGAGDTSRALEAFDVALRRLGVTPVG
jgi:hypothetical protein